VRKLAPLFAVAALLLAGCQRKPLPEAGTASANLYLAQCGSCHGPYAPSLLTPKMWVAMVDRMEILMRRRGMKLLPAQRTEILEYLERNAGGR